MRSTDFTRFCTGLPALLLPLAAGAFPFDWGDGVHGSFDTTLSVGTALRSDHRDAGSVGIANGGSARSINEDDGNLNYDDGELYSAAAKATHELELRRGDFGVFSRVSYFYDTMAQDHADFLGPRAQERLGREATLLDLYAYGRVALGTHPLNVKVGRQVVNWGESSFIGNGISVINPIDVSRLRTPGSEIREALIPTPMLWSSLGLGGGVTVEALWIAAWDKIRIDPRGSFFSSNDTISDDSDRVFAGFGRRNDQHAPLAPPLDATAATAQIWIPRSASPAVDDTREQYGVALRYLAKALHHTEFGLYVLRYHSRSPYLSFVRGTVTHALNAPAGGGSARYFDEYPEGIELYGLSFNTDGPWGVALQGEYSYRPNQPTQLAGPELGLAAVGLANNVTGTDPATAAAVPVGTVIHGYRRVHLHQLQATATKAFGPTLAAEQFVLVGEAGINDQELPDGLRFSASGVQLPAPGSADVAGGSFQPRGYADETSWGYRLSGRLDFENAIGPAQLSPRLSFSHDVNGAGPNFNQGAMALGAGLTLNYLQRWQADLGYTAFFGGRRYSGRDSAPPPPGQDARWSINANPLRDRDFVAVSISYSF